MAKKRKIAKSKNCEFNSDPFSHLKGFAVSAADKDEPTPPVQREFSRDVVGSFAAEMEMLGVKKINSESDAGDKLREYPPGPSSSVESEVPTDEEIFLTAMGDLTVNFRDCISDNAVPVLAEPRRIKQLKRGKLSPEASLDLHGCMRSEVVQKLIHFLDDSLHQGMKTVLVITGKGLHSEDGTPILRDEVESFLSDGGQKQVAEWGRAPKQYGGSGALILFLRKKV